MRAGVIDRRDPFAEPARAAAGAERADGAAGPSAEDTSECKVFVGNLPFDTEPSTLESIFGMYGDIIGVNVRHDRATGVGKRNRKHISLFKPRRKERNCNGRGMSWTARFDGPNEK